MVTKRKNVFEELLLLSKDLALWQNQVLRLLLNKGALSKTEREEVIMLAKVESGVAQDPSVALPQKLLQSELPVAPQPGVVLRLLAIREASNVNALTSGQILKFSKGMTVFYGETGSGKSSYARVMKKAFRAREGGVDEILPNVYSQAQQGPASAVFDFDENGKVIADTWTDGKPGADRFGRFAVLDSKCARLIITAESEPEILPYGLELFADLASVTDEVKEDLLRIAREKRPNPESLNHLRDQTVVGSFIASLKESTTAAELQAKASFSDADVEFLASTTRELNTLERDTPEVVRKQLQGEKTALEAVKKTTDMVLATISDARLAELKALSDEAEALEGASQAASLRLKDPKDLPGVGSLVWRELMKAAEKYSTTKAYKNLPFPAQTDGARCALCQQPLTAEAQSRLERFWAFIEDETAKKAEEARTKLAARRKEVAGQPKTMPPGMQGYENAFAACDLDVFATLRDFYVEIAARVQAVEAFSATGAWEDRIGKLPAIDQVCGTAINTLTEKLNNVRDDAARTTRIKELKAEVAELQAKERLKTDLPLVMSYLASLQLSSKAQAAADSISTRRITERAKALQTELMTEDFKQRVNAEIARLVPAGLKTSIADRPAKGRLLLRVALANQAKTGISPEQVFSEGERTAIALACFLSELATNKDNCGIIFDDPVSSFDHKIRKKVVDRLVEEANTRQVIILTHDLVFLTELVEAVKAADLDHLVQVVESHENIIGLLREDIPWDAAPVGRRLQVLDEWVATAKKAAEEGNVDQSKLLLERVVSRLRSTWERAVEEKLFGRVVERYSREVQTLQLLSVGLDDESVELVFKGMSTVSQLITAHDAPAAEGRPSLSSDMVREALTGIRDFIASQEAKNKAAEKKRVHLKKTHAFR